MRANDGTETGPAGRLLASLTGLLASLLTVARTRIELLTVELELESRRLLTVLALGLVALFAATLGLAMAGVAVIVAFWDTHRLAAAVAVAGVWLAAAMIAGLVLARRIRTRPHFLEGTLAQLARDSEQLRGDH
jgi:uncharacterized membrane protein YqjE